MPDMDVRHLAGHRHQVVCHVGVDHVAVRVIAALFHQRATETLDHAATHLLVDELRVEDGTAILDHPEIQELEEAGVGIDLDVASLDAVGERNIVITRHEMAGRHQFRLEALGDEVRAEIGDARELVEADALIVGAPVDDHAVLDVERLRVGLQELARNLADIDAQRLGRLEDGLAADARAARAPGAATRRHVIGVAGDDLHLVRRGAKGGRRNLAHDGVGALPLLGDRGMDDDGTARIQPHLRAVLGGDARTADAVHRGTRVGQLDHRREANTAVDALAAQLLLLRAHACVIHRGHQLVERGVVRQALKGDAAGTVGRVVVIGDQVRATNIHRVNAQRARTLIHEAFRNREGDRMADRAVLAHHVLVLEHDARLGPVVLMLVGPAREVQDLVGLHRAGARIHGVRADAGQVIEFHGRDLALGIEGHLAVHPVHSRMDVGQERFQPVGGVLHRAADHLRQGDRRHLVGIDMHLDAERTADITAHHPNLSFGYADMLGEDVLHHVWRLGRHVDRELVVGLVIIGENNARFERHAGVAVEVKGLLHDAGRLGECLVHVTGIDRVLEGDVVAELRVDNIGVGVTSRLRVGNRRQDLVVDLDHGCGIFRLGARGGDHSGDCLALPGHVIDRDGRLRRGFEGLEVGQHSHPGLAVVQQLLAGNDPHDTGHALSSGGVDALDLRVGMWRAQVDRVHHSGQLDIVHEPTLAAHQLAHVRPRNDLADIAIRPSENAGFRIGCLIGHRVSPSVRLPRLRALGQVLFIQPFYSTFGARRRLRTGCRLASFRPSASSAIRMRWTFGVPSPTASMFT